MEGYLKTEVGGENENSATPHGDSSESEGSSVSNDYENDVGPILL